MVAYLLLFILGLLLLYIGAEGLVRGSSRIARLLGIRPIIIGVTVVAFGTSSPEACVSLTAVLKKAESIALGNIIGSNIANIGLILGLSALISPLKVESSILRKELPIMIAASLLLYLMALDGKITFFDGLILLLGILAFIGFCYFPTPKRSPSDEEVAKGLTAIKKNSGSLWKNIAFALLGLFSLIGGAHLIVTAALFVAHAFGVSELVIGLSMVAIGTSLPELAISLVSSYRKKPEICIGNVVGSNLFNILFVVGTMAMITPLSIDEGVLEFQFPFMLLFTVAISPLMKTGGTLSRKEGVFLLVGYLAFIALLF